MRTHHQLAVITACTALSFTAIEVNTTNIAQAATISYDFTLNFIENNPYATGFFSFETPAAGFSGDVPVNQLEIGTTISGINFLSDFETFSDPLVRFESGVFQGLFFTAQDRSVSQGISIGEQYITSGYEEFNELFKISGSSYNYNLSGRICNSIYPPGTENIDPAQGNCIITLRNIRFRIESNVTYSQRSIPGSSPAWGLAILGLAFLLRRKSNFYPNL